jgi:predicted permease
MIDRLQQSVHRFFSMFRRARLDNELDAELAAHLELAIEENLQRGLSPEDARREALIQLGGSTQAKERHREARGLQALDIFLQDLRYGLRGLVKNPGFTSAAVLTLALGIAVNATMFSMVSGFLLRRPPGHEPERVVALTSVNPAGGLFLADVSLVSPPNYLAWRSATDIFETMAAADENRMMSLTWHGQTNALPGAAVSADYFTVLGVAPELGRNFNKEDEQPGRDQSVILSHELWDREFGSDPSLVGRIIRLNRQDYAVIGIMPTNFRMMGFTPQLWTPLVFSATDASPAARKYRSLNVFARLKHGATLEQARAEFKTMAQRAERDFPEAEKGWGVAARTLPDFLVHSFGIRNPLILLMSVVGFVLLIACANVAGLLLARAGTRRKELAIRLSLGATRRRIVRQLLTEGLMIALGGGVGGLLLAYWGIKFLAAGMKFNEAVGSVPVTLDTNVLLFALIISLVSALLCSLAPAVSASRTNVNSNLQSDSRSASSGRSHSRFRKVLVTGEIAAALFLMTGCGLLLRAVYLIEHQALGFQTEHLLTAGLTLDSAHYKKPTQQSIFVQELIPVLKRIPGVDSVAVTTDLPASGFNRTTVQIKGQPESPAEQRPSVLDFAVTPDFFRTAEVPLQRGRTFTETDNDAAPRVVVVNREFVHRHFKDQDPLGKQIQLEVSGLTPVWSEIIGVVGNVKNYSEDTRYDPAVYEAYLQRPLPNFSVMIRTHADPNNLIPDLRKAVTQTDVELPLAQVMSMSAVIDMQKGGDVLFAQMLGMFAVLALALAAIGIYGLISYSVGQRTHEIAIRMALGARGSQVRRMVLREGLKMAVVGAAIGLALALPLPRIFAALLNDLPAGDPRAYVIVLIVTVAVAVVATYIPARRASRIDPISALHSE